MVFEIFGGDERLTELAILLSREGHRVACLGMERALLPEGIRRIDSPEKADCVILPLPAERNGALNAPFSDKVLDAAKLLASLEKGTVVCAGMAGERLYTAAKENGIALYDYSAQSEFAIGNAAMTAEAAVSLCMNELRRTVFGSSAIVIGYGRIGKLLALKLKALGAYVSVLSRSPESRAFSQAMGLDTLTAEDLSGFDIIINTAPAPVLTEAQLRSIRKDCFVLELASAPYGIDTGTAKILGLNYRLAPGLPGKYAPQTAAVLIKNAVMNILKEQKI